MKHERYEIEPRPRALGRGWQLHFIARDMETGTEIEIGASSFPAEIDEDTQAAYADAMQTGEDWLAIEE